MTKLALPDRMILVPKYLGRRTSLQAKPTSRLVSARHSTSKTRRHPTLTPN
jgi:hypothetical protein